MTIKMCHIEAAEDIRQDYFQWLSNKIRADSWRGRSYLILTKMLSRRDFSWTIEFDENRALDGKCLRRKYANEMWEDRYYNRILDGLEGPCSMLEFLIGVAERMDDDLWDGEKGPRIDEWFWELCHNLGLDRMDDEAFYDLGGVNLFDEIVDNFCSRRLSRNGKGGIFPLKHANIDQRTREIWWQMQDYLNENYPI